MLTVLGITFPIFAMIALGYATVRAGVFRAADMRPFGAFVLNIALPAMLFQATATRPPGEVLNPAYMALYAVAGLVTITIAFVWFSAVTDAPRRAVACMGASCPNSGFVGYPLMLILFPGLAGQVLAMNFLVENLLFIPLLLGMIDMAGTDAHPGRVIGRVILGVIRRPMVIALAAGLAVSLSGLPIPTPASRLFDIVAGSAAAVSLLVIGGSLVGIPVRGNLRLTTQIVLAKLFLHPAITIGTIAALGAAGLSLTGDLRTALILTTALPMFGIYAVMAQQAGHEGLASLAQLFATTASFLTLNAILVWIL